MRELLLHEQQDAIFRTVDGQPLHVATDEEMYAIACGKKFQYVVVFPGNDRWIVQVVELYDCDGCVYLGEYSDWPSAKLAAERVVQWKGLRKESRMGRWYSKEPTMSQHRALHELLIEHEGATRGRVNDVIALALQY